ncbi:RNA polymerase sigma factor [Polystyrenella longa]|uniref:RNA polymerase sigma factor n=1 Tax=Polystyrenella longa TaxID=2528007 RepID=A0A518CHA0_9PLAN|nr:RNA polymerase sigma factor [Polystyrenella longa]QDU78605.1 RNA polymerase sigma factor [Polystyrenella longa]
MTSRQQTELENQITILYQTESRRVLATLIRLLGDFDLAEEAMQEAFTAAAEQWAEEGVPKHPRAWLISTGRFRAVDLIRRRTHFRKIQPELTARVEEIVHHNADLADHDIQDDQLRLIFTCCHPAIDPRVQIPLTLREVCGLTTDEIASAFLTAPATMAQRIVRGKSKIRDAGIPYIIPSEADLPQRLDAVLSVIYLVFNEGYSASGGESHLRPALSTEAIRLGRLMLDLLPDPEVMGLLALMLLHESRRTARQSADGDIILLDDQDRTLWDQHLITEGQQLVGRAFSSGQIGVYSLQAAISAVHASAQRPEETNWSQIVELYDTLRQAENSPIVELNRAVAVAMRDGVQAGLDLIQAILDRGDLIDYHLAHSARGELLRRVGRIEESRTAFLEALNLTRQEPERRFLRRKLQELDSAE